jgi:hypothetical protein
MSAIAIEMTIDETLLPEAVPQAPKKLHITDLEQQQIRGYQQLPLTPDEFAVWLDEQFWEQHQPIANQPTY